MNSQALLELALVVETHSQACILLALTNIPTMFSRESYFAYKYKDSLQGILKMIIVSLTIIFFLLHVYFHCCFNTLF